MEHLGVKTDHFGDKPQKSSNEPCFDLVLRKKYRPQVFSEWLDLEKCGKNLGKTKSCLFGLLPLDLGNCRLIPVLRDFSQHVLYININKKKYIYIHIKSIKIPGPRIPETLV